MDGTAASATVGLLYDDGSVKESVITGKNSNTGSESVAVKRINIFEVFLTGETEIVLKKGYAIVGAVFPAGKATLAAQHGICNRLCQSGKSG